jgi:hypothetical protein
LKLNLATLPSLYLKACEWSDLTTKAA